MWATYGTDTGDKEIWREEIVLLWADGRLLFLNIYNIKKKQLLIQKNIKQIVR